MSKEVYLIWDISDVCSGELLAVYDNEKAAREHVEIATNDDIYYSSMPMESLVPSFVKKVPKRTPMPLYQQIDEEYFDIVKKTIAKNIHNNKIRMIETQLPYWQK